jgi:hypothetical protein
MKAMSDGYIKAYQSGSMQMAFEAMAHIDMNDPFPVPLDVVEGQVEIDIDSEIIYRGYVTLEDPTGTLTPTDAADLITPFGSMISLRRGLMVDGQPEMYGIGKYFIEQVMIADYGENVRMDLMLMDASWRVARNKSTTVEKIERGRNTGSVIQELVQRYAGDVQFEPADFSEMTDETTRQILIDIGDDVWKIVTKLARTIRCAVHFDGDGICRLVSLEGALIEPEWRYREGENSVLMGVQRILNTRNTPNYVHVTGKPPDGKTYPVYGIAYDGDPNSPTYADANSRYGIVPYFAETPLVNGTNQADAYAQTLLERKLRNKQAIHFMAIPNCAHELLDTVRLVRKRAGLQTNVRITKMSIPLVAGRVMNFSAQERRFYSGTFD